MPQNSDLESVLDLASSEAMWSDRVDVEIAVSSSLQRTVTDTYRLNGRFLRGHVGSSGLLIPVVYASPIDIRNFKVRVLSREGWRESDPVSVYALRAAIDSNPTWSEEDRDLLLRCLVVPLKPGEVEDNHPLVQVFRTSASEIETRAHRGFPSPLARLFPVGHKVLSVSAASEDNCLTLRATAGIKLVTALVDIEKAWQNFDPVQSAPEVAKIAKNLATKPRSVTQGRISAVKDMTFAAGEIRDLMVKTRDWLSRTNFYCLGWDPLDLEEIRGEAARIAGHETSLALSKSQMAEVATDFERLATRLDEVELPVAIDLPDPTTEIELIEGVTSLDLAFTSESDADSPDRPWSLGTNWALFSMVVVCLGVLYGAHVASHVGTWLDTKADAVVALLALTPVLVLTQVERADRSNSPAAFYARRVLLWVLLSPLLFPLAAAFVVIQESPSGWLLKLLLLVGSGLAFAAGIAQTVLFKSDVLRRLAVAGYSAGK